jgi:hypothetical protein
MRKLILVVVSVLLVLGLLASAFLFVLSSGGVYPGDVFVGITLDGGVAESKLLIGKVREVANLVVIGNPEVVRNRASLEEVCECAKGVGLSFFVFMVHPSVWSFDYDPIEWVKAAKVQYGASFLGVYLWDEPGGNQLDRGKFRQFDNTTLPSNYLEAANTFVYYLFVQMRDFIKTESVVTSDYGLYWFDYEAGYDVVFCEFGYNRIDKTVNVALCRGAAEMHNKTWGVMITWAFENAPYIESGPELYDDMVLSYQAGARYILVFNYPQTGKYGLLGEEHFEALSDFKNYVSEQSQSGLLNRVRVAYVLPENYGWGLRNPADTIWGIWEADEKSSLIWNGLANMTLQYGRSFDVVYDSPWTRFFSRQHYDTLIWWNGTIQNLT